MYEQHGVEVRNGDIVLDVGANVGVAACYFAGACGASVVHSFEPVRPLFELLERNVAPFAACTAHPFGLHSAPGVREIGFYPEAAMMSRLDPRPEREAAMLRHAMVNMGLPEGEAAARTRDFPYESMTCELRTLSQFLRDYPLGRIDLLKIDVEGAEVEVLRGIDDADWDLISQLALETHDDDSHEWIQRELAKRGFTTASVQDEALRGLPVRMLFARRA